MLQSDSESSFGRIRRIFGKPALLSGSLAYALYALVLIDHVHGSVSRTALNAVAGIVPCALLGCLVAPVLVALTTMLTAHMPGPRGLAVKTVKVSAVLGIVAALVLVVDHLGRIG